MAARANPLHPVLPAQWRPCQFGLWRRHAVARIARRGAPGSVRLRSAEPGADTGWQQLHLDVDEVRPGTDLSGSGGSASAGAARRCAGVHVACAGRRPGGHGAARGGDLRGINRARYGLHGQARGRLPGRSGHPPGGRYSARSTSGEHGGHGATGPRGGGRVPHRVGAHEQPFSEGPPGACGNL